jgi:hypothetical protein
MKDFDAGVMSTAARAQVGNSNGKNPGRFRANQPGTHALAVRGPDRARHGARERRAGSD